MHLWQILSICGIAFLILEMFTPSLFFLNFSLSAFICAILSIYLPFIPVSLDLLNRFIIIGLRKINETNEKTKKAILRV